MASGPITSWEIDGETVETVLDFIFGVHEVGRGAQGASRVAPGKLGFNGRGEGSQGQELSAPRTYQVCKETVTVQGAPSQHYTSGSLGSRS